MKLKQEVMTKSLIGIQESADQAGCGLQEPIRHPPAQKHTQTHAKQRQHREIEQKGHNNLLQK